MFPLRCEYLYEWLCCVCSRLYIESPMRVKQRQFASAQVTSLPERATFKFLQEKTVRRDKVPEASELWQNQRFYISYIILYIIYTSFIFFFYILLWKNSNVCKMQRLIQYTPDLPSFNNFQFMANLVIFIFQATSSLLTSKSQSHIISPAF